MKSSDQNSGFDQDAGQSDAHNYEALIEICYTYALQSGWLIQPDVQHFFQPGGNASGVEDATVLGARTTISL